MKSLLIAVGLAISLSVGAQTTTDEQKQQPAEGQKAKTTTEQDVQAPERTKTRTNVEQNANNDEKGSVSHSTTVFRNGREVHESLALHRGFRDRSDVHFSIGAHPRDWWLRTYSIVVMDGCHYFLADNGCWYPAYGFDPSCNYADGVVYCE
jgi:hypothetical protein